MTSHPLDEHDDDPYNYRPLLNDSNKCTATTAAGKPCRTPAMRGTNPPLCVHHSGRTGAPKGQQQRHHPRLLPQARRT